MVLFSADRLIGAKTWTATSLTAVNNANMVLSVLLTAACLDVASVRLNWLTILLTKVFPLSSPSSRSSGRSLPSVREWIGPTCFSRRVQQLERTEGESELQHLARVAAANLAGVQGDWRNDSDWERIDHDVLRDFHW